VPYQLPVPASANQTKDPYFPKGIGAEGLWRGITRCGDYGAVTTVAVKIVSGRDASLLRVSTDASLAVRTGVWLEGDDPGNKESIELKSQLPGDEFEGQPIKLGLQIKGDQATGELTGVAGCSVVFLRRVD